MKISFYKCKKCGKVVAMLKGSPCDTMCCGEAMTELTANTTDAAVEKHVPVVTVNGNTELGGSRTVKVNLNSSEQTNIGTVLSFETLIDVNIPAAN